MGDTRLPVVIVYDTGLPFNVRDAEPVDIGHADALLVRDGTDIWIEVAGERLSPAAVSNLGIGSNVQVRLPPGMRGELAAIAWAAVEAGYPLVPAGHDADLAVLDLVSMTEIAQRAGTSPGTVRQWRRRHAAFPAPAYELAVGPVWRWPDVAAWLARPRPSGRPRKG